MLADKEVAEPSLIYKQMKGVSPCGWFGRRGGLTSGSVLPRGRNGRRRGTGGINIGSGIKCTGVAEV